MRRQAIGRAALVFALVVILSGESLSQSTAGSTTTPNESSTANSSSVVPTAGLVASYRFSGNAKDESGNGNDGVIHGASLVADRFGNPNYAYRFNGSSNYIEVPNSSSLSLTGAVTVSAWVLLDPGVAQDSKTVVAKGATPGVTADWTLIVDNSAGTGMRTRPHIWLSSSWKYVDGSTILQSEQWYHIVMRYDGGTIKSYVNGVNDATIMASGALRVTNTPLKIGLYEAGTAPAWFPGVLDDIRIYNRALSEAEIAALATEPDPLAPPEAPVLLSPPNATTGVPADQVMKWHSSVGATSYHLQVSLNDNFTAIVKDVLAIADTQYALTGLEYDKAYYWRVAAAGPKGSGAYSGTWGFATAHFGPIAYYPFNGNANDESGHGHNGTVYGATLTTDRSGKVNSAYRFGAGTWIEVAADPAFNASGDMTISAWYMTDTTGAIGDYMSICGKRKETGGTPDDFWSLTLQTFSNTALFALYRSPSVVDYHESQQRIRNNRWQHIIAVVKENVSYIYLDGVLDSSSPITISRPVNSDPFTIGWNHDDRGNECFIGAIDDVVLYDRALSVVEIDSLCDATVSAKVMLQGPYASGVMATTLRNLGVLPLQQPFTTSPWQYPGTEGVASIPEGVVDWILVELRSDSTAVSRCGSRAAFVTFDGTIVDIDGFSPVRFVGVPAGSYYIVLRHRNHLAAMSAIKSMLRQNGPGYDFTTGPDKFYGGDARELEPDVYGMWAGDVTGNGIVKYNLGGNDRLPVFQRVGGTNVNATVNGYYPEDVNMNGQVKYNLGGNDRLIIFQVVGGANVNATRSTRVPN